jgi:hypothetical protein
MAHLASLPIASARAASPRAVRSSTDTSFAPPGMIHEASRPWVATAGIERVYVTGGGKWGLVETKILSSLSGPSRPHTQAFLVVKDYQRLVNASHALRWGPHAPTIPCKPDVSAGGGSRRMPNPLHCPSLSKPLCLPCSRASRIMAQNIPGGSDVGLGASSRLSH